MKNSPTYCVDASVIGRVITGSLAPAIESVVSRWSRENATLIAPSLIGYEVANTLHKKRKQGLTAAQIVTALDFYEKLRIELVQDVHLHRSAISIAHDLNIPAAYDAHYLALSLARNVRFLTSNRRLANTVEHRFSWIEFVDPKD